MHFLFDNCGQTTVVRGFSDMMKSLGLESRARAAIMTDETGILVGAGIGAESLTRSVPLIKAMRESRPIVKNPAVVNKRQAMIKSIGSHGATGLDGLLAELANIRGPFA